MYKKSIEDPAGFWSDIAKDFYWKKQVHTFLNLLQSIAYET